MAGIAEQGAYPTALVVDGDGLDGLQAAATWGLTADDRLSSGSRL